MMISVNYYITKDDYGVEKYVITVDGTTSEVETSDATVLGELIQQRLTMPQSQPQDE